MAEEDPGAGDAEGPGRSDEVTSGDVGRQRVGQAGEAGRHCQAEGEDRGAGSDAEDHCEEEREEQTGEGDHDVDEAGDEPPQAAAGNRGDRSDDSADKHTDGGRSQREADRQLAGDEHPGQDVPPEGVGAEGVTGAGSGSEVEDVVGRSLLPPDGRCEEHEEEQDRVDDERGDPEGAGHEALHVSPA
jgi:hypothetical protein